MKKFFLGIALASTLTSHARETFNFNPQWQLQGETVTLPRAWNEAEAFRVPIAALSDSVIWYKKRFTLPPHQKNSRVFIEFEGVRQAAEVFLNGQRLGLHENGVMAFGFELTAYLKPGENLIEVRTDNDWSYKEQSTGTPFQWNNKNFNVNYGGIVKNVKLHIMPNVYQTLPLYSTLGTTGTYIYASNIDIAKRQAQVNVETQVKNSLKMKQKVQLRVLIDDAEGNRIADFNGESATLQAGQTVTLHAQQALSQLHFWSWGYGYLYSVTTIVGNDSVTTKTGFRKTEFRDGMVFLNDRVIHLHGYAQRSTNEWPAVGIDLPAWLSDYSNDLMVKSGGNIVRWMHVTPSKQDIESCDRVGLIQAMPAGDAEKDVEGRQWQQRVNLMRDAIIYNRNNPSILFYECGNQKISIPHMEEMKVLRDSFDAHGGRAIGAREMLDNDVAEYGGEMLYVNKSDTKPMWMMEYCRDEGLRKYWNSWSYPYHKEGDGPLYRNAPADAYNHNMDEFAVELVRRWHDYWLERPGTGTMVCSGGAKIVFSDTQTHCRGAENYRRSGVVDAMRIPKDAFFVHQVMWDGWVDDLKPHTYIIGHWNYNEGDTIPVVYVVSNGQHVTLTLNGKPITLNSPMWERGRPRPQNSPEHPYRFLWAFRNVPFQPGIIQATADNGSSYQIETTGNATSLRLTAIQNPTGWQADGADLALIEIEAIDNEGRRCPFDNRMLHFKVQGEAEYLGGIAQGRDDNYARSDSLPLECGVNRVFLRSTTTPGEVQITVKTEGILTQQLTLKTNTPQTTKQPNHQTTKLRGETPSTPSFQQSGIDVPIASIETGNNQQDANNVFDKNEKTLWASKGAIENAWIQFNLAEKTSLSYLCMKMRDFRSKAYPIAVFADGQKVWEGVTPKSLSYVHIPLQNIIAQQLKVQLLQPVTDRDAFEAVKELDKANDEKKNKGTTSLGIIEVQVIHALK